MPFPWFQGEPRAHGKSFQNSILGITQKILMRHTRKQRTFGALPITVGCYSKAQGLPALPPYKSIIVGDRALLPPGSTPPEGMLGRGLLCTDGDFYWPSPKAPMIANTIWVVKWNDTFQFVKETEDSRQEVYASVYPNREIVLAPNTYTGPKACWAYQDVDGNITYWQGDGERKGPFSACGEDQIVMAVHPTSAPDNFYNTYSHFRFYPAN